MSWKQTSRNETMGIQSYLSYIKQRQSYLKIFVGKDYPLTEIKYYRDLQQRIGEWAKKHRVAYQYISGRISSQEAIEYMGVNKRMFWRLIAKQREELITFIQETEKELEEKYSFIPFTDEFMDNIEVK